MTNASPNGELRASWILLGVAALNCAFQIAWFWRFCAHNITMDAISYIGLARHLLDGNLTASLHGYWSPLLTWLIAAGSVFTHDFTLVGRVITIASFLGCLPLLYALVFRLWHSHLTASFAVLWLSLARGILAGAVITIQADFLFAMCTLTYFILLLGCLREGTKSKWLLLGVAHAIAFTAKAIAMPWLFFATLLAAFAGKAASFRNRAVSLLLALLAPCIMWITWGEVLKTKYGVFTTGYQLKANLMTNLRREESHYERGNPLAFVDTTYDQHMVAESAWPAVRQFTILNPALIPVILKNELRNLPAAVKEIVILLSPGGALAFGVALVILTRRRISHAPEAVFSRIAVISSIVLFGAYGMLVFDSRYVAPILPILMALASYFMLPGEPGAFDDVRPSPTLRKALLGLLIVGVLFFTFYWASPFRTIDRDFQVSVSDAAMLLKTTQPSAGTFVSIGSGPYPDHGVGFEAAPYVGYLSQRRLIAMNYGLPDVAEVAPLATNVLAKKADAVLVWGRPGNQAYRAMVEALEKAPGVSSHQAIADPQLGEVGRVFFFPQR